MRRARLWILGALLLLAAGAALMGLSEGGSPAPFRAEVQFPRSLRPAERQRMESRRTLPALGPAPGAGPGPTEGTGHGRDPLLWALPPDEAQAVVVLEANALRHSRLGELFLACLGAGGREGIDDLRKIGIDPLRDVDRVAVSEGAVAVSGFFERVRWDEVFRGAGREAYGAGAVIYAPAGPMGGAAAVWRNQLLFLGNGAEDVRAAVDRVEGRAPTRPPIREELSYGEVYGVLPGEALRRLFPPESAHLASRLAELASRVELHADAMSDVAATVRVVGSDAEGLADLGRSLGAALAVARAQARARGDQALSELLDYARVSRGGEGFSLELALPVETLERWLAGCRERGDGPP